MDKMPSTNQSLRALTKKLSNHQLETHTNGLLEEYSWLILTVRYSMLEFVTVSNAEIESGEKFWAYITDELKIP